MKLKMKYILIACVCLILSLQTIIAAEMDTNENFSTTTTSTEDIPVIEIGPGVPSTESVEEVRQVESSETVQETTQESREVVEDETLVEKQIQEATQSNITRVIDPTKPMVALTIDDGPHGPVAYRMMDVLAKYNAKATFYIVGDRIPGREDVVRRMAAEGHEIGNHTMNHKFLNKVSAHEIIAQVQNANTQIQQVVGLTPATFRLPGGIHNETVRAHVGMPMIQWSIDTNDWRTKDAQKTVSHVLENVKDGDIILLHELYEQSAVAMEILVPELINRGFQLVTVSELASANSATLESGKLYSDFHR